MSNSQFTYQGPINESNRNLEFNDDSRLGLRNLSVSLGREIEPEHYEFAGPSSYELYDKLWMELSRGALGLCKRLPKVCDVEKTPYLRDFTYQEGRRYPDFHDILFTEDGPNGKPTIKIRKRIGVPILNEPEIVRAYASHPQDSGYWLDDFDRQIKRMKNDMYLVPPFARITVEFYFNQARPEHAFLSLAVRDRGDFSFKIASEIIFSERGAGIIDRFGNEFILGSFTCGQASIFRESAASILCYIQKLDKPLKNMQKAGVSKK